MALVKQQYDETIRALNKLQSNTDVIGLLKPTKASQAPNIQLTYKYLNRCKIELSRLDEKVVHVSGTKGKGSTCALTEAALRARGFTTGFYSSPHLFSVTERIRINGKPLSLPLFNLYFWQIYNRLDNNKEDDKDMPTYFKFLTLMAFHVFICERVDVAIFEVGIGGQFDCTNVLRKTKVVGVTSLGLDHMSVLGNSLEEISWHKAGIMKEGCLAFTSADQPPSALSVLRLRAQQNQCTLYEIEREFGMVGGNRLLELNSALALHLAAAWIHFHYHPQSSPSIEEIREGVELLARECKGALAGCLWPGRFQIVPRGNTTFYLDGAHTGNSIALCADWFSITAPQRVRRVLLFNLTGSRDARSLLMTLSACSFHAAIFCPNRLDSNFPNDNIKVSESAEGVMERCGRHAALWRDITGQEAVICKSVSEALQLITIDGFLNSPSVFEAQRGCDHVTLAGSPIHILVTGSLHLVGNVTCFLHPDIWDLS